MLKKEKVPESWITVHRAMQGHRDHCLDVIAEARTDDPIMNWFDGDRSTLRKYFGYILSNGFKSGRVIMAQPRAGVCVASPVGRTWSPTVFWARLRLLLALTSDQRETLNEIETAVEDSVRDGAWCVQCLAVRQPFRDYSLYGRLLRQALSAAPDGPVLIQTAQPTQATGFERKGGECVAKVDFPGRSSMVLYRIEADTLQKGFDGMS